MQVGRGENPQTSEPHLRLQYLCHFLICTRSQCTRILNRRRLCNCESVKLWDWVIYLISSEGECIAFITATELFSVAASFVILTRTYARGRPLYEYATRITVSVAYPPCH